MSIGRDVLVIAEQHEGELHDVSLELLSEGCRVADELQGELCAVVLGNNVGHLTQPLAKHGADKIYSMENPLLVDYSGEFYTDALSDFIGDLTPKIILCGATSVGSDLASRIAARIGIGLVSNCISIKIDQNDLLFTKATHGNQVHTTFKCASQPQIATFEPGALEVKKIGIAKKIETMNVAASLNPDKQKSKVTGTIQTDLTAMDLSEADVIVAGGKGVGSADNFRLLEDLAYALGGCVAGTRMALDAGWIPSDRLVGQTGSIVRPKLYIACGISGALHHTLGMKNSKTVVAINTDANAPIFRIADVGIVGDLLDVIPSIVEQLLELKAQV
ncbi:MAG: electron transfer flavoprotein subunit alpha/FixB family protein [Chloroflexi bacterium]|jgi:electron transfer flavoprotein alpha subunit|nr:electron transfer flavoprotein subunit alpha/FixB family protein [Chloroflexota bacterium]MBT7081610.1 electron transfer flavoprotein subunit alpha/FixB family protein [Chloroflexota bacterium]MBT7290009.1 electron transfer flavoprotein subunit alpha/FixB family protein [Chloroflexota bacterium]